MAEKEVSGDVAECDNSVQGTQECLDRVIPKLLDYALSLIPKKRIAASLSSRYNGRLSPCTDDRWRGTYTYTADMKGIERSKVVDGGKQKGSYTETETVTRERFLELAAMSVERSLDVYRHLKSYIPSPARPELPGDSQPMDDII